jgi:hypothetical protein
MIFVGGIPNQLGKAMVMGILWRESILLLILYWQLLYASVFE